jgi:hypothetical protein
MHLQFLPGGTSCYWHDSVESVFDELEEVIEQVNAELEQIENGEEEEEVLAGTFLHISSARKEPHENLNKQAKRIKIISYATHPPVDVGGNVILPISDVDWAKAHLRNLVGVVLERSEDGV